MKFQQLIKAISLVHSSLQNNAVKAVNRHLTFRNWLIGYYIVEFEQHGEDRAAYGIKLRETIAEKIKIKGLTAPVLLLQQFVFLSIVAVRCANVLWLGVHLYLSLVAHSALHLYAQPKHQALPSG